MRRLQWILAAFVLVGLWWAWGQRAPVPAIDAPAQSTPAKVFATAAGHTLEDQEHVARASRYPAFLPPQAHGVLQQIQRGGPYRYRQDGGVFHNRERRLPPQPRGYYREYTVETPGSVDRGPRRIVTGGGIPGNQPPREYWYTDDHYRSFRRFEVKP